MVVVVDVLGSLSLTPCHVSMSWVLLSMSSTFSKARFLRCLAIREYRFDKYSHGSSGRVNSTHNTESKTLLDPWALLKLHIMDSDPGELVPGPGDLAAPSLHWNWLPQLLLSLTGHIVNTLRPVIWHHQ